MKTSEIILLLSMLAITALIILPLIAFQKDLVYKEENGNNKDYK